MATLTTESKFLRVGSGKSTNPNEKITAREMLWAALDERDDTSGLLITDGEASSDMDLAERADHLEYQLRELTALLIEKQRQITALGRKHAVKEFGTKHVKQLEARIAALEATVLTLQAQRDKPSPDEEKTEAYPWTSEVYCRALDILLHSKRGMPYVSATLGMTEGSAKSKINNDPPDEVLLGRSIQILDKGPMSYLEFWKIGFKLHGMGFKKEIAKQFKLGRNHFGFNDPVKLSEAQCAELRQEWAKSKKTYPAEAIVDAVWKAREKGMTGEEMVAAGVLPRGVGLNSSYGEIIARAVIFDSGERRGRGKNPRGVVWVHEEFHQHFPHAWSKAIKAVNEDTKKLRGQHQLVLT